MSPGAGAPTPSQALPGKFAPSPKIDTAFLQGSVRTVQGGLDIGYAEMSTACVPSPGPGTGTLPDEEPTPEELDALMEELLAVALVAALLLCIELLDAILLLTVMLLAAELLLDRVPLDVIAPELLATVMELDATDDELAAPDAEAADDDEACADALIELALELTREDDAPLDVDPPEKDTAPLDEDSMLIEEDDDEPVVIPVTQSPLRHTSPW